MTDAQDKTKTIWVRMREAAFRWWGGVAFKISFFMTIALVLVAALVGVFFFLENNKALDTDIRNRALYVARELAMASADDIKNSNRYEINRKLSPLILSNNNALFGNALLYLIVYDKNCNILAGTNTLEIHSRSAVAQTPLIEKMVFVCDPPRGSLPVFDVKKNEVYDLIYPVLSGTIPGGFIRVGISGTRYGKQFGGIMKKAGVALLGILLVGLAFGRIIALWITKPISRLYEAVEKLSHQNWDTPIRVKGSDEISRLGHAFNQMALTLKERETSLSRGNGDLFLLHTAGLDLMESLDRDALLTKIVAHVEALARAETTTISAVNTPGQMLKYLGVFGYKANAILEREQPIEAGGIYNWLVSYGTPLLITDAQADFRLDKDLMKTLGIKSMMVVPFWSANVMTGLLTVINKKGGGCFDKHDLRLLTVFSSLAASALQNAALYGDLRVKMNELETAQEQLVHSTKMAAIGELSANVAHEINNPLTSVLGYTTHLLKTASLPEAQTQILKMMEQEMLRVRKFIRNLLDFARHKPSWMQPEDITLPLRETTALVQGIADASSVMIHEEYLPTPVLVNMDHNEMKQVFINIVTNALQAMPRGGELRIKMNSVNSHELVVEFSDTGVGINAQDLNKIFRPFFSTKSRGEGTGLGLSISQRIVRSHGGRIETESEEGKGSVFKVFLPLYQRDRSAGIPRTVGANDGNVM